MLMKKKPTTITAAPEVSTFSFKPNELDFRDDAVRHEIRTVTFADKPNDPWFVARDLPDALGFTLSALKYHLKTNIKGDERGTVKLPTLRSGLQEHAIISESALYKLIMRSDKPEAKKFQDWVTRDVLPAIRKDGMYVKGEEKVVTGEMSMEEMTLKVLEGLQSKVSRLTAEKDALTEDVTRKQFVIEEMHDQVGALSEDNAALEAVKAEMEPMVEGFQHFLSVDGTYNKEAVAKILGFPSAIKLNRWLSYMGIQSARKTWKGGREHIKYWYLRAGWVKRNDLFKTKTSTDVVRGTQVHI